MQRHSAHPSEHRLQVAGRAQVPRAGGWDDTGGFKPASIATAASISDQRFRHYHRDPRGPTRQNTMPARAVSKQTGARLTTQAFPPWQPSLSWKQGHLSFLRTIPALFDNLPWPQLRRDYFATAGVLGVGLPQIRADAGSAWRCLRLPTCRRHRWSHTDLPTVSLYPSAAPRIPPLINGPTFPRPYPGRVAWQTRFLSPWPLQSVCTVTTRPQLRHGGARHAALPGTPWAAHSAGGLFLRRLPAPGMVKIGSR